MCVLVYTLPQLCGHTHLQNVAECDLAAAERSRSRGPMVPATTYAPPTEPRFLFDTAREAPAAVERVRAYPCRKRRAVRPAPVMCEECMRAEWARRKEEKEKEKEELEAKRRREEKECVKHEEEKEEEQGDMVAAFLAVPRAVAGSGSAGSSLALMTGSNSVNTFSDAGTSGKSHS